MKNIFFDLKEKIPKEYKVKEGFIKKQRVVLILEKKKEIVRAKIKQKRGQR